MRVGRWVLVAAVAVALGAFVDEPNLRLELPELVVAAALSVWAFGTDERPLVHEAHELGVGPRAVIQGAVCGVFLAVFALERSLRGPESPSAAGERTFVHLLGGVVLILPAWIETRARAQAARPHRDLAALLLVFIVGASALPLLQLEWDYVDAVVSRRSLPAGLEALRGMLVRMERDPRWTLSETLIALVFIGPALARLHEARPREVLVAGLASAAVASVARHATNGLMLGWSGVVDLVYLGIALALGAAFADKLTRKLERRLPKSHSHEHLS